MFFAPFVLAPVAVGAVWKFLYAPIFDDFRGGSADAAASRKTMPNPSCSSTAVAARVAANFPIGLSRCSAFTCAVPAMRPSAGVRAIMNPAMIVVWCAGLALAFTPGIVDWSEVWPWTKSAGVLAMTGYQEWLGAKQRDFVAGTNRVTGRQYRIMNEVPTLLMIVIVASVIVKF